MTRLNLENTAWPRALPARRTRDRDCGCRFGYAATLR
jgi:hypothetical protein